MKILKIVLAGLLMTSLNTSINAQCVTATPNDSTIGCGSLLEINAIGTSSLPPVLATTFNGSTFGPGWLTTPTVLYTNPCGPSLDGTPSAWFGGTSINRSATTIAFDLSCGAEICFDLDFASDDLCGGCSDCEDPDLFDEGVFFSYSINNGATWVDIFYFEANNTNTLPYYQWDNYCFTLPPAAWTSATMLRWQQPMVSSQVNDHWGFDNIFVTPSDCNYYYDWAHIPGFPDSPTQTVSPGDTTTYYVSYTDGTTVCSDSVVVNVVPLQVEIVANPNPLDCGSCADLSVDFLNGSNGSYFDNFDAGIDPIMWGDIQSGTPSTICGGGATGNALYFDGTGSNRYAETIALDATTCGNIDFCLFMGNTASGGNPCDNNETGDNLVFEYSINGGTTFVPIATYSQALWDGANYQQCFSEPTPAAAQTSATLFRWRQVAFGPFVGSDNWSIDEVEISCNPATISYLWSTGLVSDAISPTPSACPTTDDFYTVSVMNSVNGCNATDTATLFVNDCVNCFFVLFDGALVFQPGGILDVSGNFEYSSSPATGTLEVVATNGTGSYSQTFNAPFTDNTVFNYMITGIPDDGSTLTMAVFFSDSLSCGQTFDLAVPSNCYFSQFEGAVDYQPGGLIDVNGIFQYVNSPATGTLEVEATNATGTYSQSFNPPFINNVTNDYSIAGIPDDGSIIALEIYFTDSTSCTSTFDISTVGVEVVDGKEEPCVFAPNPVYDEAKLIFNNESQTEVTITIVNERGQLVFETTTTDQSISINGDELKQGIYFYAVKSGDGSADCAGKFAVTK